MECDRNFRVGSHSLLPGAEFLCNEPRTPRSSSSPTFDYVASDVSAFPCSLSIHNIEAIARSISRVGNPMPGGDAYEGDFLADGEEYICIHFILLILNTS